MDIAMDEIGFVGSVIVMARPAAWRLVESPRGLLACALDPEEAAFRPNVTVTVDEDVDAALNQRVAALQASLPQVVVIAAEQRDAAQAVTVAHESGGTGAVSTQRYVPVVGGPVAVVTYTCSVEQYPDWWETFQRMADACEEQATD